MKSIKNVIILSILCFVLTFPLFAQSVNAQIDDAIVKKNSQQITKILNSSKSMANTEAYVLKKARDLVSKGDLDFALEVTLCVVDADMENFEALDLYSSIDKAIKKRNEKNANMEKAAQAKLAAEKEAAELAEKVAIEKEKKKKENNRKRNADLVVENGTTGEIVYIDQNFNNHYASFSWKVNLGLLDFTYALASPNQELKYGLMADTNLFYHGDAISVGAEFSADISCLNFVESAKKDYMYSAIAKVGVAVPAFTDLLFLDLGYFDSGFIGTPVIYFQEHFSSPTVGLTLRDLHFGKAYFETAVNYYLSSIWNEKVSAAGDLSVNFFIQLVDLGKVDLGVNVCVKDIMFVCDTGLQNQAKIILGIEVFSNE